MTGQTLLAPNPKAKKSVSLLFFTTKLYAPWRCRTNTTQRHTRPTPKTPKHCRNHPITCTCVSVATLHRCTIRMASRLTVNWNGFQVDGTGVVFSAKVRHHCTKRKDQSCPVFGHTVIIDEGHSNSVVTQAFVNSERKKNSGLLCHQIPKNVVK